MFTSVYSQHGWLFQVGHLVVRTIGGSIFGKPVWISEAFNFICGNYNIGQFWYIWSMPIIICWVSKSLSHEHSITSNLIWSVKLHFFRKYKGIFWYIFSYEHVPGWIVLKTFAYSSAVPPSLLMLKPDMGGEWWSLPGWGTRSGNLIKCFQNGCGHTLRGWISLRMYLWLQRFNLSQCCPYLAKAALPGWGSSSSVGLWKAEKASSGRGEEMQASTSSFVRWCPC